MKELVYLVLRNLGDKFSAPDVIDRGKFLFD